MKLNNHFWVLYALIVQLCLNRLEIYCLVTSNKSSRPPRLGDFDKEETEKSFKKSLEVTKNVSKILDKLLQGYDKRLRPNYAGPPVTVGITININNINSVSEVNMDYSMDIFFRQLWVDKRLSFDGVSELVIGSDMLHRIWLPDTYLANDKKTYFHKATVQNKFIRINPDGQVLYSMRFTVTSACPMDFKYFPMDSQVCNLEIESYGFRMEDIKYKWGAGLNKSALDVASGIELPQFKYRDYELIDKQFRLSTGVYSRLILKLFFDRSLGYYIIQIYIPSSLIVVLSWVSFWLDRTAAPARVSLGITTVLTMVTFIWSTNASLPKISYVKAIDVYLVCCFIMTFSSVIEYAAVSYVHMRFERKKRKKNQLLQEVTQQNELQKQLLILRSSNLQLNASNSGLALSKMFGESNSGDEAHHSSQILAPPPPQQQMLPIDNNDSINPSTSQQNATYYANHPLSNQSSSSSNHHHHHHQQQQQPPQIHHGYQQFRSQSDQFSHNPYDQRNYKTAHSYGQGGYCARHECADNSSPLVWNHEKHNSNPENPIETKSIPILFEKQKSCCCSCTNNNNTNQANTGSISSIKANQSPLIVSRNSATLSKQTSLNQQQQQQQQSFPSNVNPTSSSVLRQQSCTNQKSSISGGGVRGFETRSLSQPMGFNENSFSSPNEAAELATSLLPLNMRLLNESQQKLPSLLKSVQKSSDLNTCVKASTIDNYSRIIFPVTFFSFHIIYWTVYLIIAPRLAK